MTQRSSQWRISSTRVLPLEAPVLVGILNVTPDSFSDGGRFADVDSAVQHGLELVKSGATMLDVGGESTRPGSKRMNTEDQKCRVLDVIRQLRQQLDEHRPAVAISIDTTLSEVARAALEAGAEIINDVSAGRDDRGMFELAAERGVPLAIMHMRGTPKTMQDEPTYRDVVGEVRAFLLQRAGLAEKRVLTQAGERGSGGISGLQRAERRFRSGEPGNTRDP